MLKIDFTFFTSFNIISPAAGFVIAFPAIEVLLQGFTRKVHACRAPSDLKAQTFLLIHAVPLLKRSDTYRVFKCVSVLPVQVHPARSATWVSLSGGKSFAGGNWGET